MKALVDAGNFPGARQPAELIETHISWVILTPDFAFKIKKPVTFDFLDFSTLQKRRYFCEEEVRLNGRLAPGMYVGVLPIGMRAGQATIGETGSPVVDYAVQMHRLDNQLQMDKLLAENRVSPVQMQQLATLLASFHRQVAMTGAIVYHPDAYWTDFAEIYSLHADIENRLGARATQKMKRWGLRLPLFLEQHAGRLQERVREGFWVDGHGDLHARNIFLSGEGPIVFDCIEFNPHFRQSDILNELAFLCMDLDAREHSGLAGVFLKTYLECWNVFPQQEDWELFRFFKAYRANVRLKVALLELRQHDSAALTDQVRQYWNLLEEYLSEFD